MHEAVEHKRSIGKTKDAIKLDFLEISLPQSLLLTNLQILNLIFVNLLIEVTSLFSETKGFFCFSFNKRSPKDAAWKTEVFCIRYFSKTKRKSTKSITERCFSYQNNSVCRKLARSCTKWKSAKKRTYALFARRPSIIVFIMIVFVVCGKN